MCTDVWFKRGHAIPRKVVQIPQDQQELLSRQDAWDGGIPNVPGQVLEDLKRFHLRKPAPATNRHPPRASTRFSVVAHNGATTPRKVNEEDKSDAGTAISWSPSPRGKRRTSQPVVHEDQTDAVAEPPASSPSLKQTPALRAFLSTSKRTRDSSGLPEFPSSCASSEADLDVEVPGAITDVVKPFDRDQLAPVLVPTPPSAQVPVIPSTFTEQATPAARDPPLKRRRLMKPPKFGDHSTRRTERVDAPAATASSVLSPLPASDLIASSAPASAPLATEVARQEQNLDELPSVISKEKHAEESSVVAENSAVDHLPETDKIVPVALDEKAGSSPCLSSHLEEIPRNGPRSQVPYVVFKLAYPDFQSNLSDFLRGVICIKIFQPKKILPEFLYDDFVRVFASGFMDYISQVGEDKGTLTAWQWYCDNVQKALYHQNVLKKDNLQDVLDKYPAEVRKIMPGLSNHQIMPEVTAKEHGKEVAPENPPASTSWALVPSDPGHKPKKSPLPLARRHASSTCAAPSPQRDGKPTGSLHNKNLGSRGARTLQATPTDLGNSPLKPIDIDDAVSTTVQDGRGKGFSQATGRQDMTKVPDNDRVVNDDGPLQSRITDGKYVVAGPGDQHTTPHSARRELPASWSKSTPGHATGYTFKTQPSFGGASLESIQSQLSDVSQGQFVTLKGRMASPVSQLGYVQGSQADSVTYTSSGKKKRLEHQHPPVVPAPSNGLRPSLLPSSFGRAGLDSQTKGMMQTQAPPLYKKPARASFDATIQSTPLDIASRSQSRSQTVHADSIPETTLKPRPSPNVVNSARAKDSPPTSNKTKRKRADIAHSAESWRRFILKESEKEQAAQSSAPAK